MNKFYSILLLLLVSTSVKSGNTFRNLLKHSNVGVPAAIVGFAGAYHLTGNPDIATTSSSALALGSMQAMEYNNTVEEVLKEASKPVVGHLVAKAGVPALRAMLKFLNVPAYLLPEQDISPRLANLIILTYVSYAKMTGQLIEI